MAQKSKQDEQDDERMAAWRRNQDRVMKEGADRSGGSKPSEAARESTASKLTTMFRMGIGAITGDRSEEDKKLRKR